MHTVNAAIYQKKKKSSISLNCIRVEAEISSHRIKTVCMTRYNLG